MINPALYAEYYWLTLVDYDDETWEIFKESMGQFPKAYTWDGWDDENHSICFKFATHVPRNESEIKICKERNLKVKRDILKTIENNLHGKVYFNKSKGILKNLEKNELFRN